MPEFVACPACGCRVQMADSLIGMTVRCISCNHGFTATSPAEIETRRIEPYPLLEAPSPTPPLPHGEGEGREGGPPLPYDVAASSYQRPAGEPDEDYRQAPGAGQPCCPRCGRPTPWNSFRCPHCGQQLEFDGGPGGFLRRVAPLRRDAEPHRGPLLASLGNVTLAAGGLTLCLAGAPLLVALPLGVMTWVMASNDLRKMRTGEMEPEGRGSTETARTSAITGMVLSVFFAAGWALLGLIRLFQG